MSTKLHKVIQIGLDGNLSIGGQPIVEREFGKDFLSTLYKKDYICRGLVDGEMIIVESINAPLVVQDVQKIDEDTVELFFNYGHCEDFKVSKGLMLDDWSRLCGENDKEVPFVFSIGAQVKFLEEVARATGYDTFKFGGREHELLEWYVEKPQTREPEYWSESYDIDRMPWDLGKAHPCIEWTFPRLKLFKSKVLIPGCGRGHDVAKIQSLGHNVTGLDFSKPAVLKAEELYPHSNFIHGDFFKFSEDHVEEYDMIFEHTLFCALSPENREKLIKAWHKTLMPGGHLVGTFLVSSKRTGPPFGVTEWELEKLLEKYFKIDYWGRLRGKESARPGKELFVYAQKRQV